MSQEKTVQFEKSVVEFFVRFIDTMSQRGNIRGDELATIGQVRNLLVEKYKEVYSESPDEDSKVAAEES